MNISKTLTALLVTASVIFADVPSIMIYCDPGDYGTMIDLWHEDIEIDCTVTIGDTVYSGARIRLRGDSSRGYPKKSYRITLPVWQPYNGRIEWNFNAEYLDETYIHSWMFAWIMERLDYPCFSIDHVRLYVNDAYIGLYVRGEPVDEQFLLDHGMDPDANLYKASVDGACLSRYDDVAAYWEKKANEGENWTDLYSLIEYLDGVDPVMLHESAGEHFELNSLLSILAVNSLTLNYSTYYHNYYMYRDIRGTGLWTCLPWDVDKTFGDWISRTYTAGVNAYWYDNPLIEKVLLDPVLLELYFDRIGTISEQVLTPAMVNPVIDSLEAALSAAVEEDTLDGITIAEFHEAVEQLRDIRIPGRIEELSAQYQTDPRPFRAFNDDTVSLGEKFVCWESTSVLAGDSVNYALYLYTVDGWPFEYYEVHALQTDTCYTFTALPAGSYVWRVDAFSGNRVTEGYDRYNPFTVDDSYTLLSGTLSGITVLTASQSPFLVTGDVYIPPQASLFIEGGVDLRLRGGVGIDCEGDITSTGNAVDSVRFLADNVSEPWGGIRLDGGDADLAFVSFSGSAGYGVTDLESACIVTEDAGLSITNSRFSNNFRCINMMGGSILMDSCDLTGWNSGELFSMRDGDSALIQNSAFGNMTDPPSSSHDGIEFQDCLTGEYIVRDCQVYNIDGDAFDSNSSSVTFDGNTVWNVTDKGFSIGIGAAGSEISNVVITGCIVSGCNTGIAVKDDSHAEITGCTIGECDVGIRAYNKTVGSGGGFATVTNSILSSNSTVISLEDGSEAVVNYCLTGDTEPWTGEGNIADDPRFAGWGGLDRHLSYESPCIDTGSPQITDPDGTRSDMGAVFFPQAFDGLVLNEVQSVNDTTIADGYGEYDDWLEIYNGSDFDCDLSWVYLSDDPSDLDMYRFPAGTTVPEGGFLLVWADAHPWQNGYHLPFTLSGGGDSLYLSRQPVGSGNGRTGLMNRDVPRLVDSRLFGPMAPDVSCGRVPDGGAGWSLLDYCTPGWSNSIPYSDTGYLQVSDPFPNPVFSASVAVDITVDAGQTEVSVYDLAGRLVDVVLDEYLETGDYRVQWDTTRGGAGYVPTGVYLINVRHSAGLSENRKIVVIR